jgi:hypothetical protein
LVEKCAITIDAVAVFMFMLPFSRTAPGYGGTPSSDALAAVSPVETEPTPGSDMVAPLPLLSTVIDFDTRHAMKPSAPAPKIPNPNTTATTIRTIFRVPPELVA